MDGCESDRDPGSVAEVWLVVIRVVVTEIVMVMVVMMMISDGVE